LPRLGERHSENFKQRAAVINCTVSGVEQTGTHQQISKPRPFKTMAPPINFGCRATSWLEFELRPIALRKFALPDIEKVEI
jgi:hypothetical protein